MKLSVHDIARIFDAPTSIDLALLLMDFGAKGIGGDPQNNALAVIASAWHGEPVVVGEWFIYRKRDSTVRVVEGFANVYGPQVARLPFSATSLFNQMAAGKWPLLMLEAEHDDDA